MKVRRFICLRIVRICTCIMTRTVLTRADARTVAFRAAANQARNKNPVTQAGAQAVAVPFRGDIEKAQAAYTAAGCVAACYLYLTPHTQLRR